MGSYSTFEEFDDQVTDKIKNSVLEILENIGEDPNLSLIHI